MNEIYNFDSDGLFVGTSPMEVDPIDKLPMIPANATTIKPIEPKEGFTVNFVNGNWVYMEVQKTKPEQPNEPYYIWNEESWSWDIDEAAKSNWMISQAKSAVYTLLDQTAKQYDYRDFAEVAQFVNSNVWKAEADGLLAWQDAVWVKAYELLKSPVTNIDDFVEQLPMYISVSGS
jgi:hypothetical protein